MKPKISNPYRFIANLVLRPIERTLSMGRKLRYPPVFIIGVPRSGTTILRQLIASTIQTSYISNFGDKLFRNLGVPYPAISAIVLRLVDAKPIQITYTPTYGTTPGRGNPSESEHSWAYWFKRLIEEVAPSDVLPQMKRAMYRGIAATQRLSGRPFVNKTTVLSLRIRALVDVFPGALFIHVQRDPIDVAQSLLVARDAYKNDWLGAKPRECEELPSDDVVGLICAQVRFTHQRIVTDQEKTGSDRFLTIEYEQLCANPPQELERVKRFFSKFGVPVTVVGEGPKSLPFTNGRRNEVSDADYARLMAYFRKHPYKSA